MAGPLHNNRLAMAAAKAWRDTAAKAWRDTTEPEVTRRAFMAPLGEYSDGTVNWAWPSILADGVQGWNSLADSAARARENPALMFDEDFNRQAAADSFNAAGLAATGGFASGAVPEGALASNAVRWAAGLPMDLASRMARAMEMGFDTSRVWYHGGDPNITSFDADATSRQTGPGVWLTSSYDYARAMAGKNGKVYKVYVKPPKKPVVEDVAREAEKLNSDGYLGLPDDATNYQKQLAYFGSEGVDRAVKSMMNDYNDAVILENFWDLPSDPNSLSTAMFVRDPRNIRSVNAAFDPAMADSANLLAANTRTAAAVPAGMAASEGDDMSNDPFLNYILRQYGGQ